jgi:cytochrome c553
MSRRIFTLVPAAALAVALVPMSAAAEDAPGKTLFLAQKCSLCHSIASENIVHTTKSEKMKGPALDGASAKHEEAWLAAYLTKKEKLHDKTHPKEAKLSPEELSTLVQWLKALPPAP